MGITGAIAFFVVIEALDNSALWEKKGATRTLPLAAILSILASAATAQAACALLLKRLPDRRRRYLVGQPATVSACTAARCPRLFTFFGQPRVRLACTALLQFASGVGTAAALLVAVVWILRYSGPLHLDDLTPAERCLYLPSYRQHAHAKFLWIIPSHDGVLISANRSFIDQMKRLQTQEGFVLGMHGVRHEPHWGYIGETGEPYELREFEGMGVEEARARLEEGFRIWRDAFNATPTHFSFPGQWGSEAIVNMLWNDFGVEYVRSLGDGLLERIYHCDDSWCPSPILCRAWALDLF